tara:strand:- start:42222 stop:43295 length:1074 start_codon:yes stop_codon:yes gene_type:complete
MEIPNINTEENSSLKLVTKYSKKNKVFDSNSNSCQESLLVIKPANEWNEEARKKPNPKRLFGDLWYEGEVCIFFSDTNLGKSILAVQIGDSISKGIPIPGFQFEAERQKVLYCDFELSDKQFQIRYTNEKESIYQFDDDFLRAQLNPDIDEIPKEFKNFDYFIINTLEQVIISKSIRILIVDNLTYLNSETEKTREGSDLMKKLKRLKNKYRLSLLALAHTPKRNAILPITRNDLMGSSNLMNFCDSCFALGDSTQGDNIRYIKPIKVRNAEKGAIDHDVTVVAIEKSDSFLHFDHIAPGYENDHLKTIDKKKLISDVIKVKENNAHLSLQQIADKTGTYKMNVTRILKANGFDTSA